MFGMQMGQMGLVGQMTLAQRIAYMFANSEPGAWYDPSDMSTLFQDSAGTVPVTAVEQPVGRMLDKSGRGNHATQATTTKRPVYSRRVNQLINTANQIAWAYQGSRFTAGGVDGSGAALLTASVQNIILSGVHTDYPIGASYSQPACIVRSIEVKAGTATHFWFGSAGNFVIVRLSDGVVEFNNLLTAYAVTPASDGFWRIELHLERLSGSWGAAELSNYMAWGMGRSGSAITSTGQIGSTVLVRRPSFVVESVGFRASIPYQRVNTATDYDADPAKFPAHLRFDGVDDAYQTNSIDFTGTDKMTVWAGITKLSDATAAVLAELSPISNTNDGSFKVLAADPPGTDISASSRGTATNALNQVSELNAAAPGSYIISSSSDIAGDRVALRVNSIPASAAVGDQGAGNYGNYPLYIGARSGTTYSFNGRLYGLIVRGAQSSQSQIEATELYVKRKMKLP